MTTPESEPDPYAGGESQSWRAQPVVPGWSAGQDWYAGPHYDDTGWHIDLSNVDWGDDARYDRQPPHGATFRYESQDHQEGNGVRLSPADHDWPADDRASRRDERPGGRHARAGRAGDDPLAPGPPAHRTRPARGPIWEEPSADDPKRTGRESAGWDDGLRGPRERWDGDYRDNSRGRPPAGRGVRDGYRPDPLGPDGYGPDRYGPDGYPPGGPVRPDWQELQGRPDWWDAPGGPDSPRGPDALRRPDEPRGPDSRRGLDAPRRPDGQRPAGMRRVSARPPTGYAGRPGGPGPGRPGPGGSGLAGPGAGYADAAEKYGVRPARPEPARPPPAGRRREDTGTMSIVRSGSVMAVGTLGSRLTGFLRTIVQSAALGTAGIAAAYNLANTLPNVVYNLALGGILTSVIVPLIVNASKRDADRGEGFDQRMFTLVTAALLGMTLVAMIFAAPLVHLYSGSKITGDPAELHLAVIFAYFFIPQIFFYGVSSLISAILNSRGSFAAPMWTPIVNNFVVIAVLGLYVAMAGLHKTQHTISSTDIKLLGLGTTLGIIAQTGALVPALRRVGFRWQRRLDFRRSEVAEIGRMAGWMTCYIAATQVAFLVTMKAAGDATIHGVTEYGYAWLLFQLPYAVVGISVITALLPRMSAHAADRRLGLVRADFSTGVRMSSAIVVPCSLVLAALGPSLGQVFLAHGATELAEGHYEGVIFAVFCLGMLPYMIFQLQLRVFYSLQDSRTPALIGLATMTVNIVANLLVLAWLPASEVVAGLGAGFGLANLAGAVLAWRILSRRLRGLDGWLIGRSLVRMHAATLPAALIAILVSLLTPNPYAIVIIGGGLAVLLYLTFARALRIEELTSLTRTVTSRLRR